MKRIVRLTESDLTRLVRRIIKEQNEQANPVADKILSEIEYLCKTFREAETVPANIKSANAIYARVPVFLLEVP